MIRRLTPAQRRALEYLVEHDAAWRPEGIRFSVLRRLLYAGLVDCYFGDGPQGQGRYWYIEQKGRRALADGFYEDER